MSFYICWNIFLCVSSTLVMKRDVIERCRIGFVVNTGTLVLSPGTLVENLLMVV